MKQANELARAFPARGKRGVDDAIQRDSKLQGREGCLLVASELRAFRRASGGIQLLFWRDVIGGEVSALEGCEWEISGVLGEYFFFLL